LEESLSADEGGELGQRLLTGTTHTDEETVATSSVDDSAHLEQVVQSIVEDHKWHLLGWELLVVAFELGVRELTGELKIGEGFVHEWSKGNKFTVLVVDVLTLEIGKEHGGHELIIIETEGLTELLLGGLVKNVREDLLVVVVGELIHEGTFALVAPQSNQEQLWADLLLEGRDVLDNLVLVLLSNLGNTTEHTGQLTNSEQVMELSWGWEESLTDSLPNSDGGVNQESLHVDHILSVALGGEQGTEDGTVDVSDGLVGWWSHVDGEELTLQTVRNIVPTTTWVIHGTQELEVVNLLEITSLVLVKEVEALLDDELTSNLKSNLITPSVNEWHAQVI
jgi:hypothetical protein